jgi:hypothetical protein
MEAALSLIDKPDNQFETSFWRGFDPESARRQFRMSMLLVVAMAVAAFILGFALPMFSVGSPTPAADSPEFSGRLVNVDLDL